MEVPIFLNQFNKVKRVDFRPIIRSAHERVENSPPFTKILLILFIISFFFNAKESTKPVDHRGIKEIAEQSAPIKQEEIEKKKDEKTEAFIGINIPVSIFKSKSSKKIAITEIVKNEKALEFICHNEVLTRAFYVQEKTGLSVATILAQKGLESNFSKSTFTARTKNLSNIKCIKKECRKSNWKGAKAPKKRGQTGSETSHCIQLWDDGPNDRYVKHDTFWEGWEQYAGLINKTYSKAASKKTVREEAIALKKRGFATDRNYANKIVGIAKKCNFIELQKYINEGYTITTESGKYVLLQQ
jgi:flagellum-specific peptidoglycan hydrolase FlgJ